jgi:hypothetical protein
LILLITPPISPCHYWLFRHAIIAYYFR